jgi:hypothetical protein
MPTIEAAQNNKKYANGAGKLAYLIGAYVSHQQLPKKNIAPKIQPSINDPRSEFFSL